MGKTTKKYNFGGGSARYHCPLDSLNPALTIGVTLCRQYVSWAAEMTTSDLASSSTNNWLTQLVLVNCHKTGMYVRENSQ